MKNKIPKESMFKKRGFYVALYSSLGVVMVLAAAVSFHNLSALDKPAPGKTASLGVDFSQLETTSKNPPGIPTPKPVMPGGAGGSSGTPSGGAPSVKPSAAPAPAPAPKPSETPGGPSAAQDPEAGSEEARLSQEPPDEFAEAEASAAPVFNAYDGESKMAWPLLGEVVMDFSDTHAVYDKTLDQYRTNDTLCIAAELGSRVAASAEGLVVKVTRTKENGNTVVIDHGNGWTTTYSQLQDGMLVAEGDVVRKGQVIGGVASPSIYSVLLGNHVGFKVAKDNEAVNPAAILE